MLGLGLLCWGFKGVQEEILSEESSNLQNRLSGISTRTIYQSTTPSLSQTIWPRWASRQFLTVSIVQTLLPVTFVYSLRSMAVVMRHLRRWKRLWRKSLTRLYKKTSMGPSRGCWKGTMSALQPEEITSKGLEFYVCTIDKSAYTKQFGNLSYAPCISFIINIDHPLF